MKLFQKQTKKEYSINSKQQPKVQESSNSGSLNFINNELVVDHNFDFSVIDDLIKTHGLTGAVIDKIVDFTWGTGFYTTCKNEKAKQIIDMWINDVNFDSIGRSWFKQALTKGFSALELGGNINEVPQGIKVLNSNRTYCRVNDKGLIIEYRLYKNSKQIRMNQDYTLFKPFQIAHLNINNLDIDSPYGFGIVYPWLNIIEFMLSVEKDMKTMSKRKAGVPIIATLGTVEEPAGPADIDAFSNSLAFMNNQTEWVVGANVQLSTLDYKDWGKNFTEILTHIRNQYVYACQVPLVLLGEGNVAEGLAGVQMDSFMRRIQSLQTEIEKVIENSIFRRILNANGLNDHVEFEWGQPSQDEKNLQINQITTLLSNPMIDPMLYAELQNRLAELMGLSLQKILPNPEAQKKANEEEKKQEENTKLAIIPGTNATEFYEGELICGHNH